MFEQSKYDPNQEVHDSWRADLKEAFGRAINAEDDEDADIHTETVVSIQKRLDAGNEHMLPAAESNPTSTELTKEDQDLEVNVETEDYDGEHYK